MRIWPWRPSGNANQTAAYVNPGLAEVHTWKSLVRGKTPEHGAPGAMRRSQPEIQKGPVPISWTAKLSRDSAGQPSGL
jgi:hypothetical protein